MDYDWNAAMGTPTSETILRLLDRLAFRTADELESEWVEFKPWDGPKESLRVAVEYAVCFANAGAARSYSESPTGRGAEMQLSVAHKGMT